MASRQNNNIAERIERAILGFEPTVALQFPITFDDVKSSIRVFMRNHPEVFWFSHQYHYDEASGLLMLDYNFNEAKARAIEAEIEKIVADDFQAGFVRTLTELERLVYVYKWIANRTTYNEYSSFNQTIYSVLVNRNSVCTGYAKTAQYLLETVGLESRLVFGKFHADKTEYGRHGWNIVRIDGRWYHVDFCLADKSLDYLLNGNELPVERDSVLWNYFGVTTAHILGNRSIELVDTLPECDDSIDYIPYVELRKPNRQFLCCKSDSGTSSRIYLNSYKRDTVIKVARDGQSGLIEREDKILADVAGCRHIVKSYGITDCGLELEQLTPLSELLKSHYYNPTESELRYIIRQLTEGLIECRDRGLAYSDIHYSNVLVAKDGTYKWGDFGIAFPIQDDGQLPPEMIGPDGKPKGSYWFMAPETYYRKVFKEASAIYSVAMIAYFVINDMHPPFWTDENHQQEALSQRLKGRDIACPIFVNRYKTLWKTVRRALSYSENNRPCSYEEFLLQLDSNAGENLPGHMIADADGSGCVDYDFAKTACPDSVNSSDESDSFASTLGGRWGDGRPHDADLFAYTAAFPGNTVQSESEQYETYQPEKKESKTRLRFASNRRKWWQFWRSSETADCHDEAYYGISASLYAPAQIQPGKAFIVRVYLYKPDEADAVDAKVSSIDPNAKKKEYKPLDLPVKNGDKLAVRLKMSEGITLDTDTKSVVWRDHFTDCSFMARLTDNSVADVFGTAYISVNGIPAGELLFTIDVVDVQKSDIYAKVESRRYSRIFISYSHADEIQVRGFAECCRALGTDYFFDRHTLKAGDMFKDKILSYINNADLFVLCWSRNAAESEWVRLEREHALALIREGKAKLAIYPLSLKPEAPLPSDMSDKYNFGIL